MNENRWYRSEYAWLGGTSLVEDVLLEVAGGRFVSIVPAGPTHLGETRLAGITLPGLANAHSHAFHRALRGATQTDRGTFWTWREQMYGVASRLDPDNYLALASATFAEMALAGITSVGEFHYIHHAPDGSRYTDANAFGHALIQAAREAGIRLTLLDACYLTGGIGEPLSGVQTRFGDGDADAWASRVDALTHQYAHSTDVRIGSAVHSVRGVPADQIPTVAAWAKVHNAPLHVHVCEQRAENEASLAAYGKTPVQVLADAGALGARTTAVHATVLTPQDVSLLGSTNTCICLCPTTERDLADGLGPGGALARAGAPLSLGSDSQAVIDLFEEARGVELHERLATGERGHFAAAELLVAATAHGSLGWADAGQLAVDNLADLITIDLHSVRTAGCPVSLETAVFAAAATDVRDVLVGGRFIVRDGVHQLINDVPGALKTSIKAVRT